MDQKKLYKTVETIANRSFTSEKEMLTEVINQIVENEEINVTGGRLWKLIPGGGAYSLLYHTGSVEKIDEDFKILIDDYPLFDHITKERTVLGDESYDELRNKGILKYSASGVGEKFKFRDKSYYEYILAINSNKIDDELRLTLNIIATALTSQIKEKRQTHKAKALRADLDKARELQKSILPEHEYKFHNYILFSHLNKFEL